MDYWVHKEKCIHEGDSICLSDAQGGWIEVQLCNDVAQDNYWVFLDEPQAIRMADSILAFYRNRDK